MQVTRDDIALNTYDFREMRGNKAIYVDKTEWLYQLVRNPNSKFFFISRPRRFGKSLMISTLKSIFQGDRALFEGLAISKTDYPFKPYPVLHFSFASLDVATLEVFKDRFAARVASALQAVGYTYDPKAGPDTNFSNAIRQLAAEADGQVVVLIDEYDAPVGHALDDPAKAEAIRAHMAAFYGQLKENVGVIRFMMMTGVSKFTQLSVFSALNNIVDLSFDRRYATLFGYTDQELDLYFAPLLREHAEVMGLPYEAYREQLHRWYNGYRFSPDCATTVYNPYAIAQTLYRQRPRFTATWTQTGHASVLMNYLKGTPLLERDYEAITVTDETIFDAAGLANINPIALLYQSGYLTIRDYDDQGCYILGVPDEEVRRDLLNLVAKTILTEAGEDAVSGGFLVELRAALSARDFPTFFGLLRPLYAHLPYGPTEAHVHESSYQRLLYTLLVSAKFDVTAEDRQSHGRADLVARAPGQVFVFELKVGGSADEALAQIRDKGYAVPYLDDKTTVTLIGLAFDPATHLLADAKAETLP